MTQVDFNVTCRTQLGDRVFLAGDIAVLGSWKVLSSKAELITGPDDYPRWTCSCRFPISEVKYQIVILRLDGSLQWEDSIQDRELQLVKGMPDFSMDLEFNMAVDIKRIWIQNWISASEALTATTQRASLSEQRAADLALKLAEKERELEQTDASASAKDAKIESLVVQVQAMEKPILLQDQMLTEAVVETQSRMDKLNMRRNSNSSVNSSPACTPRDVLSSASTPTAWTPRDMINSIRPQTPSTSTSTPMKWTPRGVSYTFPEGHSVRPICGAEENTSQQQVISSSFPKLDSEEAVSTKLVRIRRRVYEAGENLPGA